jgi:hypothetical protein
VMRKSAVIVAVILSSPDGDHWSMIGGAVAGAGRSARAQEAKVESEIPEGGKGRSPK